MIADPTTQNAPETGTKSKLQLEAIVEESIDAIIGESLEGIILSWNGGAKKMFGYSAEEAIGKHVLSLLPPEFQSEVPVLLEKVKKGEVVADYDSVRIRKDGSRINVALSVSPIHSENGTIIGASVIERDITARKKAEEVLRQIHLIVENSYDAIIGESFDGIILSWNGGAERMFGYSSEEAIGKQVSFLFPPELKNEAQTLLGKVKKGEVVADYDSVRVRKDGSKINVSLSVSPVHSKAGQITAASVVERDITARKKSEQHISELNEIRNKFIDIISHQLRTPLGAVNWNLEMLLKGDFGKLEVTQEKLLQATYAASLNTTSRIHDLLTAMDVEEGRVTFDKEEISIDSICAAVINEKMNECKFKNISCTYIPPVSELPQIYGDSEKIRTVFTKLVENAISYTKEGGKISAKFSEAGHSVRFEISDNGIGIPAQEQHRIFDRFARASNASVMLTDAFGLGLFLSKHFIEQQGGKIGFQSKEGVGSTFWFELPAKE